MTKSAKEAAAKEECFEWHGCFTGDCPHETAEDCGRHFFNAGWDACIKHLAESGDWFDPITLKDAFVSADPSEIAIEPLYRWGARYQHSRDQLVIQALREEIRELKKTKPQD